jgi:hypothetical protein
MDDGPVHSGFCTFDAELSTVNSQQGLCASSVRAGSLELQTHQECPPRRITPLECTDTRHRRAPALESTLTNSLDLNSPRITASWPFGSAEVLWRSATAVTPLECTDTKNGLVSSLECTDTNPLGLKSFRFHSYKKPPGGPLLFPLTSYLLPFSSGLLASLPPCFFASLLPFSIQRGAQCPQNSR